MFDLQGRFGDLDRDIERCRLTLQAGGAEVQLEIARDQAVEPELAVLISPTLEAPTEDECLGDGLAVGLGNDPADEHVIGRLGGEDKIASVDRPAYGLIFGATGKLRDNIGLRHVGGCGKRVQPLVAGLGDNNRHDLVASESMDREPAVCVRGCAERERRPAQV